MKNLAKIITREHPEPEKLESSINNDDEDTNRRIIASRLAALNLQQEYADFYSEFTSRFEHWDCNLLEKNRVRK